MIILTTMPIKYYTYFLWVEYRYCKMSQIIDNNRNAIGELYICEYAYKYTERYIYTHTHTYRVI